MSLYSITNKTPEYFLISLINSQFMSYYVNDFVNNTQTFQINDARQIPIVIPCKRQLEEFKYLFDTAVRIKTKQFSNQITTSEAEIELSDIQGKLDISTAELYRIV